MTGAAEKDRELLSVSIAAGPAVTAFLETIDSAKTGLLTSTRTDASTNLTVFRQPPGSDPARILKEIRVIAGKHAIDHLIIECEPDRPPMAYASLFAAPDHLPQTLNDVAQLTATVFVIQPSDFLDAILGRGTNSLPACFVAEQVEFVRHLLFDAASGDRDFDLAHSIALALNPRAEVSPLSSAGVKSGQHLSPTPFDFEAALAGAGWRQLLDGVAPALRTDNRITALAYEARRPFHPGRFWELLQKKGDVFRAKGFFWLATRMDEVGGLNLAGSERHCASAGAWWATRDQSVREAEMPERTRNEWKEPFGDRRQTVAIMAFAVDRATLQSQLDACLLTDGEMADGPESWENFSDPFPSWSTHAHHHDHDCDHDHDSEEDDCCHH